MFIITKFRRFFNHLTLPLLSCAVILNACGDRGLLSGGEPGPEEPSLPQVDTKLTISTTHATNSSMELYWVLFDSNGVVVLDAQSQKAIRRASSVDLKGKAYELTAGSLTAGSTVAVLGFVAQGQGDTPTINEAISKITEPIVVAKDGASLAGDFFYGKFTATNESTATGELKLERISGQVTLLLAGNEALVASVLRVEFNFAGAPFYNGITGSGSLLKAEEGSTVSSAINLTNQASDYMLPSIVATGDKGSGRIYYGQGKIKDFTWETDAALRLAANKQTTITLTLSSVDPEPEPDTEQIAISITSSQSLVSGSSDAIDNGITGKGYYTYKLIGKLSKANFIPGTVAPDFVPTVMVLKGNTLYVGNKVGSVVGQITPSNKPKFTVEKFDIATNKHLGSLPSSWNIAGNEGQIDVAPSAMAMTNDNLYVGYGNNDARSTRVVVYNLANDQVITCIGRGVPAMLTGDNVLDIDVPMSMYADNQYLYLIDSHRGMRIYNQSDITQAKYSKITPYAKSAVKNTGKPHIVSMFHSPDGTLYRTDSTRQQLLAINPSKIVAGDNLDVMNPTLNIDLSGAMFDDTSIIGLLSTMIPYGVAYHHGNMFVVVNSEDNSSQREGYLSQYSADGKTFIRSLRYLDGYTVKRPVAIIITGDKMIISDQLNKNIAIIQITYHPTIHYE